MIDLDLNTLTIGSVYVKNMKTVYNKRNKKLTLLLLKQIFNFNNATSLTSVQYNNITVINYRVFSTEGRKFSTSLNVHY